MHIEYFIGAIDVFALLVAVGAIAEQEKKREREKLSSPIVINPEQQKKGEQGKMKAIINRKAINNKRRSRKGKSQGKGT